MSKKILCFSIILILTILILNISYASDVLMELNTTNTTNSVDEIDTTTYSSTTPEVNSNNAISDTSTSIINQDATNYEDSSDLSISNIINIILIVVGVVLILLGIAIIIKIK